MNKLLIAAVLSSLLLFGCTQRAAYQCANGNYVDSASQCPTPIPTVLPTATLQATTTVAPTTLPTSTPITPVNSYSTCGSITASGTLSGNIYASGSCLVIAADNIVLDCNGYLLDGNRSKNSTGIFVNGHKNVVIRNCQVERFENGIMASNSQSLTIEDSKAENNEFGFFLDRSHSARLYRNSGIKNKNINLYLYYSNDAMVSRNVMQDAQYGIRAYYSTGNSIEDNNVSGGQVGVNLYYSQKNFVLRNELTSSKTNGLSLINSTDNRISSNIVRYNVNAGMHLFSKSGHNTIESNSVSDNGIGLQFFDSEDNTITGNTICKNQGDLSCYSTQAGGAGNTCFTTTILCKVDCRPCPA